MLLKSIQGHWGHLPAFRRLRRGRTGQRDCLPSSRLCGFPFVQARASVHPPGSRPALAARTPWIPGPLSRPVDSAPGAAGRCPACAPGSPSSGALSAPRLKYPRPGAGGVEPGMGKLSPRRAPSPRRGCGERGWGSGKGPRAKGRPGGAGAQSSGRAGSWEAAGREDGAQVGALSWTPLTCRARRPGPEAKGGRGDAGAPAAAAAAACPTLGRAARGSGTCLRPCDPGPPLPPPRLGKPPPPCSPAPALPSGPRHAVGRVTLSRAP